MKIREKLSKIIALRILRRMMLWLFSPSFRKYNSLFFADQIWHIHVSSYIAKNFYYLYYPIVYYSKKKKWLYSINNITNAVGHIYPEIDYIYRMKALKIIPYESKVICLWPKNPVNKGFVKFQNNKEIIFVLSGFLEILLYPMLMRFKEITVNASQSVLNHHLSIKNNKYVNSQNLGFKDVFQKRQLSYFKIRKKTADYYPLKKNLTINRSLNKFIGSSEYYIIQIKDIAVNATAMPVDPNTYLPAIELLNNLGFKVVFAGREIMPTVFKTLNVINYAQSDFANSENDFILVSNAKGVIASASGFCYIPDLLDIPLLSLNNWVQVGYSGKKTIQIPTLLNKLDGSKLNFKEQLNLAYEIGQITNNNRLPLDKYECIDASAEDILDGINVLISSNYEKEDNLMSNLQKKYNNLFIGEPIYYQLSRLPNNFLKKNIDRF